jgi:hypothetical protein
MQRQPLEIQTLYAELLERLAGYEAGRTMGHVAGSFVTKAIKGQEYYYFQHLEPGGQKRQIYIGRRDEALDRVAERHNSGRGGLSEDQAPIQRLASLLRAGGAMVTDSASARVLKALGDAGVFRLGGVLVGTHAFVVIGNLLGVQWSGATLRTQDVDVAASSEMSVALPNVPADIPSTLESLEMGFLPVPGLDPASPTTSFKVRGQGLRVDLLTPAQKQGQAAVVLPRFSTAAQPLKFLDFVMDGYVRGAVIDGGGTAVNVPAPARFAFHKLIVAGERPTVMHTKRQKDLWQAAQIFEVLAEERPGDVGLAWETLASRGKGWVRRIGSGLSAMGATSPAVADEVRRLAGL